MVISVNLINTSFHLLNFIKKKKITHVHVVQMLN